MEKILRIYLPKNETEKKRIEEKKRRKNVLGSG